MSARIQERTQFVGTDGKPLVNGLIFIGEDGLDPILNPITIFSDRELTIVLANPQTLDSFGRSANKIWIPGKYSMKVEDVDNVQVLQDLDAGALAEVGNTILTDVLGADTITANAVNTISSYIDGQTYILTIASNNTTGVTLNIDGLGEKAIQKNYTEALIADDFVGTFEAVVVYNGDNDIFQWVNNIANKLFPAEYLDGALITRNSSDFQNVDIAAGKAIDSTNTENMTLQAFTKLADTAWAVGDAAGALLNGSLAANTAYDIWAILTTDRTTTDYGFDTVANGIANIPTGYTLSRKIGRFFTDADINILPEIVSENDQGFPVDYVNGFIMNIGEDTLGITSVTNNGGTAVFNFTPGPTLAVNDKVIISGFSTNTAYNGTFAVTAIGTGTFETNIAFGTNETGSFNTPDFNTVTVAAGNARDDLNTADLIGAGMTKDISTIWASGDGNGGLFTGTVATSTVYYFFAIKADADGSIDYGWDTSIIAANIPTGYTAFLNLSIMLTNSASELVDSMQGVFNTGYQVTSGNTDLSFNHGLGIDIEPNDVIARISFITATNGYVAGDRVKAQTVSGDSTTQFAIVTVFSETELTVTFGNKVAVWIVMSKTSRTFLNVPDADVSVEWVAKNPVEFTRFPR